MTILLIKRVSTGRGRTEEGEGERESEKEGKERNKEREGEKRERGRGRLKEREERVKRAEREEEKEEKWQRRGFSRRRFGGEIGNSVFGWSWCWSGRRVVERRVRGSCGSRGRGGDRYGGARR